MTDLPALGESILAALPGAAAGFDVAHGELNLQAHAADIVRVLTFLRDDPRCRFSCIIDVTAVDWPSREKRFTVA